MVNFFDSEACPHYSEHIIDLMFLTEVTSFEKWSKRLALSAVLLGLTLTFGRRLLS